MAPTRDSTSEPSELPTIQLLGHSVHAITEEQCVDFILTELRAGRGGFVQTPNLDHLRRLDRDESFRAIYRRARLRVPDGIPLLWAGRLQGTPFPGRVAGSDLIHSVSAAAAADGRSLYFLGGDPGTAEGAAECLQQRHPGLKIAGCSCPTLGFEKNKELMWALTEHLLKCQPDIVFVALGSPKQERVMAQLDQLLPHAWWLGVGISFSFVTGEVQRAPRWMQRSGLEWIHRLSQEPGRLAKRYLLHGIPFALRLLTVSAWRRIRHGSAPPGPD